MERVTCTIQESSERGASLGDGFGRYLTWLIVLGLVVAGFGRASVSYAVEPLELRHEQTEETRPVDAVPAGNQLIDTDGNGLPDYAYVADWDGDGTLEMIDDLRAAIQALTDMGPKLLEIAPGNFVGPPPLASEDILVLPSHLTLSGSGQAVTILNGFAADDLTSAGAVITTVSPGAEIVIRELEIDGGWGSADATELGHARMGILLSECVDCRVERVTVRDTLHSCFYSRNGSGIVLTDNIGVRCGNFSGGGARFPCVYLYAGAGQLQENVSVTNTWCEQSGQSGLNTRRHSSGGILRNLSFHHNTIVDTRVVPGEAWGCIYISGVDGASYTDNTCIGAGALWVSLSTNVTVDGLQVDSTQESNAVQVVGSVGLTLRNLQLENVDGSGIYLHPSQEGNPIDHEGLTISDSTLRDVDDWGVIAPPGTTFSDVTLSGNNFDGTGFGGIYLRLSSSSESENVVIEDNLVRDFGREFPGHVNATAITVSGQVSGLEVRHNLLEDVDGQASYGIVYDVLTPPADPSGLCSNEFSGTFETGTRYFVTGTPDDYQGDDDLDSSVNACDCSDQDDTIYPHAPEINDGADNQCPGEPAYGIVDEISGLSGFFNPGDRGEYSWPPQLGATGYEVVRSEVADFSQDCTILDTLTPFLIDSDPLLEGALFYYLTRAVAPNIGSWGRDSAGNERDELCP